jgi:hypothetical protein
MGDREMKGDEGRKLIVETAPLDPPLSPHLLDFRRCARQELAG